MTTASETLLATDLPLPNRRQGKVRDIYDLRLKGDGKAAIDAILIVASDRISAFDVVMPNGVPDKGVILTQISAFWFEMIQRKLAGKLKHHLLSTDPADIPGLSPEQTASLRGRVMIGRKTKVIPIECVVRGYVAGSAWGEYQASRSVCGLPMPAGMKQCQKLPEPIFTPSTKEEKGHDQNITFEETCQRIGPELAKKIRDLSLAIYTMGHDYAAGRGIILADTKFEFGLPVGADGKATGADPILIDEVLTPDSSRFWPADRYEPGHDQPSFDKQYVRNYLQELVSKHLWDKTPPGPELPAEIVHNTRARYLEAYRLLTGRDLAV